MHRRPCYRTQPWVEQGLDEVLTQNKHRARKIKYVQYAANMHRNFDVQSSGLIG
jgi:hypothetical protein